MEKGITTACARHIALEIEYDGTAFNGWQMQNGGRTVQDVIEKALGVLTGERSRIIVAGRTDTGVHALHQVAHFTTQRDIRLDRICIGLNGIMEKDVSIKNAFEVPADFHARYSAVSREYIYRIYNNPQRSPFMIHRAMWVMDRLDIGHMREALGCLLGENDFRSFCKKVSSDGGTVRRITSIDVTKSQDMITVNIQGNAFLHNMIRIIMGTACDLQKQRKPAACMKEILERRDRIYGGPTAPACGLYLNRVYYDPSLYDMKSAF
jgi:tRNA pseudouridine38-40 synthase